MTTPTTLAAVFTGQHRHHELRLLPIPPLPPGTALVRVLACTLCGSDVHSWAGRRAVPTPTILGHEIVGEIVAMAADLAAAGTEPLRLGDRVVWAIVAQCGACPACRRGLPQKCAQGVKYGHEAFQPDAELRGGLAGHCLLAKGTTIVRLPDDLPLAVACPASCATATVVAALEAAGPLHGRSVLVFGAGMLGLTACAMARSHGADRIVCVEPDALRRERAHRFGADEAVANGAAARDGYDVLLEFSGQPDACAACLDRAGLGATIVFVGAVFPGPAVALQPEQVVRRLLQVKGVHNYAPRHLVTAVQFLCAQHRNVPFAELVGPWWSLSDIDAAFAAAHAGTAVRVGIRP